MSYNEVKLRIFFVPSWRCCRNDINCWDCKEMNCPNCNSLNVGTRTETDRFQYGADPNFVMLEAQVPVRKCADCNFEYTDFEGEDARQAAIDQHLSKDKEA